MVALDTGFFVAFMRGNEKAKSSWHWIKKEKIKPVVSVLTIGELLYILYREEKRIEETEEILRRVIAVTRIIDTDITITKKGAEIKHLLKIPYIDSLICATAILHGCKRLFTSDRKHMESLKRYGIEVVVIQ